MMSSLKGRRKSHPGEGRDDNSKKGPNRKLDFSQRQNPLSGKVFYLDLLRTKGRTISKLKSDLQELGGTVEEFLTKDISYVISDRPEARDGNKSSGNNQSANSPAVSTPSPFQLGRDSGLGATDSPTTSHGNQGVVTRGKVIANKASFPATRGSTDVLATARNWKIPIHHIERFQKYLAKEIEKRGEIHSSSKERTPGTSTKNKYKETKLQKYFLKVEDATRRFRPITKEKAEFPRVIMDTSQGTCPFDATSAARGPQEQVVQEKIQAETTPANTSKDKTKDRERSKEKVSKLARKNRVHFGAQAKDVPVRGYCESCRTRYNDLEKHLKSIQHEEFVNAAENYASLDAMISEGPNLERFLEDCVIYQPIDQSLVESDTEDEDEVLLISDPEDSSPKSPSRRKTQCHRTAPSSPKLNVTPSPKSPAKRKRSSIDTQSPRKSVKKSVEESSGGVNQRGKRSPHLPIVEEIQDSPAKEYQCEEAVDRGKVCANDKTASSSLNINVGGCRRTLVDNISHGSFAQATVGDHSSADQVGSSGMERSLLPQTHSKEAPPILNTPSSVRKKLSPRSRLSLTKRRKRLLEECNSASIVRKAQVTRGLGVIPDKNVILAQEDKGIADRNCIPGGETLEVDESAGHNLSRGVSVSTHKVIRNSAMDESQGNLGALNQSKNCSVHTVLDRRKESDQTKHNVAVTAGCTGEAVSVQKNKLSKKKGRVKHKVTQTDSKHHKQKSSPKDQAQTSTSHCFLTEYSHKENTITESNRICNANVKDGRKKTKDAQRILMGQREFPSSTENVHDIPTVFQSDPHSEKENRENFEGFSVAEILEAENTYEVLSVSHRDEKLKNAALNVSCNIEDNNAEGSMSTAKSLDIDVFLQGVADFPSEGSEWEEQVHHFMTKLDEALETKHSDKMLPENPRKGGMTSSDIGKENQENRGLLGNVNCDAIPAVQKDIVEEDVLKRVENIPEVSTQLVEEVVELTPSTAVKTVPPSHECAVRQRQTTFFREKGETSSKRGNSKSMPLKEKDLKSPKRSKGPSHKLALKEISNNVCKQSPLQGNSSQVVMCSTPKTPRSTKRDLFGVTSPSITFPSNLPEEEQNIILDNFVHDTTEEEVTFPKLSSPHHENCIVSPVRHFASPQGRRRPSTLSRLATRTSGRPPTSASPKSPSKGTSGGLLRRRRSSTDHARKALFLRLKVSPSSKQRQPSDYPMSPPTSPFKSKGTIGSPCKTSPPLFTLLYDSTRKFQSPILVTNRKPNFSERILQPRRLSVKKRKTSSKYRNLVALNLSLPSDYNFDVYEFHDDGSMASEEGIAPSTPGTSRRRSLDSAIQVPPKSWKRISPPAKKRKASQGRSSLKKTRKVKQRKILDVKSELDVTPDEPEIHLPFDLPISFFM